MLSGLQGNGGALNGWPTLLSTAFGIDRSRFGRLFDKFVDNDFFIDDVRRNFTVRHSVFTNENIRKRTFTAFNLFKKKKTKEFREYMQKFHMMN